MGDLIFKPASGGDLILQEDGGSAALTIDTDGNTEITNDIEQADGKNIQTDEIRARDGDGLKLYDDDGNGIFVKDEGNCGIGTATPSSPASVDKILHISGTSAGIVLEDSDTGNAWDLFCASDHLYFKEENVQRFIIKTGGNVGIGTDSPVTGASVGTILQISDGSSAGIVFEDTGGGNNWEIFNASGVLYHYSGAHRLTIAADGTFTGSGSADISDERLKENIETIPDALQKIENLTGRTFTWKEEADMGSDIKYGLIAQELEAVIPELVYNKSGIAIFDKDGNFKKGAVEPSETDQWGKSITMTGCIPILIEAVKELSAKVTALENA